MLPLRIVAPSLAAAAIVLGLTSSAPAATQDGAKRGSDVVVLTYPSLVETKLVRAQDSVDRATTYADDGDFAGAARALGATRRNLSRAWAGAKYVIRTTPPPPPPEDKFHPGAFLRSGRLVLSAPVPALPARPKGDPQTGPVFATPFDTGFAVLSLQHFASASAVSMFEVADAPLVAGIRKTVNQIAKTRKKAIRFIHKRKGPGVKAGWRAVMSNLPLYLNDEIQQNRGMVNAGGVSKATARFLSHSTRRTVKTRKKVKKFWPPLPPQDAKPARGRAAVGDRAARRAARVCVHRQEPKRISAPGPAGKAPFGPRMFRIAFKLGVSMDGFDGDDLPISIERVCNVPKRPKRLQRQAARLSGADGIARLLPTTQVFQNGTLLEGDEAHDAVGLADTANMRARLAPRNSWGQDEDGNRVPTFGALEIKITD
jgi:hypothetical protein